MKMMKVADLVKFTWNDAVASCYCGTYDGSEQDCYEMHLLETYEEKLEELSDNFIDSVLTNGVKTPVAVGDKTIWNGHHRLILAMLLDLDELPVCTREEGWSIEDDPDLPYSYSDNYS
jgi:hypothetical protein